MSPWLSDLLLRTQTDERLAALAQLGHQRAFETLVERYRDALCAYAMRLSPNRGEDLVQQTFLAALAALQGGTEVRHLRGWLYEILRNLAWRESGSWPATAELDDTMPAAESAQQVAERRMLAHDTLAEVAQLPASQHDALVQTAIQGRSRTEVAAAMGLSEGAVRQLVHRARTALRTAVTAITPFPLLRWLAGARSGSAAGLSEATIGAGTAASGAGVALKLGVGALVASGVVATGVISAVSPTRETPARPSHVSAGHRIGGALAASGGRTGEPRSSAGVTLVASRHVVAVTTDRARGAGGHHASGGRSVTRVAHTKTGSGSAAPSAAGRPSSGTTGRPSSGTTGRPSSGTTGGGGEPDDGFGSGSGAGNGSGTGSGAGSGSHGGRSPSGSEPDDGGSQGGSTGGSSGSGSSDSGDGGSGGSYGGSSGSGSSGSDDGGSGSSYGGSSGSGASGSDDGGSSGSYGSGGSSGYGGGDGGSAGGGGGSGSGSGSGSDN